MDKENNPQPLYPQPETPYEGFNASNFSLEGFYAPNPLKKRALLDPAPIHEARPFKRPKVEEPVELEEIEEPGEVPAPDSFPPIIDDGQRPSHSYAVLIGMSILRATNRRLTLAQIYKWITDTYSFYKNSEPGWQNSIRHNLSLNKAFVKQERPKDDPGKGNYWAIVPGTEHQFIKEKSSKKMTGPNENVPLLASNLTPINELELSRGSYKTLTPALPQEPSQSKDTISADSQLATIAELSSDATIPGSDALAELDEIEELPHSPLLQSSPSAMNSSPPVARHSTRRHDTPPPPVPRFQSSSRTRSHKRKYASMDDSGYYSSLDSSAMRSRHAGRLLTSEADRPRIKRGRAEEEIARLRGSSYDSPSKGRAMSVLGRLSSSPARRDQRSNQMLPPLTPAMKLKAPAKPPPSVSPNTNLRLHRERVKAMVGGSPLRGCTTFDDLAPWSPEFNLDDAASLYTGYPADFDIFANVPDLFSAPGRSPKFNSKGQPYHNGSPEKRSAKRPRIDRAKSSNALTDITNTSFDNFMPSIPTLHFDTTTSLDIFNSPVKPMGSPSKLLTFGSPSKLDSPFNAAAYGIDDDFFGSEFLSEEVVDDGGMDIMQGFQKIGGGQAPRSTPKLGSARPPFARSLTSRF
jgi:forkhead transcription factor HCM1